MPTCSGTRATAPVAWELLDASGKSVAHGQTKVFGKDGASGDHVHLVDFTAVKAPGQGYVLKVGEEKSFPFDIGTGLYQKLNYDALAYFYHNRSGIEIKMPFAGKPELARPAGHLHDKSTRCLKDSGCDYALDASRGWYDAGDHGKYVVNGGISVWTLLNWYERTKHIGASSADFADGKLNIPEGKNGVPDILDEARWEHEFLMGMQVPEGKPLAGMVHHKMHDESWTGLVTTSIVTASIVRWCPDVAAAGRHAGGEHRDGAVGHPSGRSHRARRSAGRPAPGR